MEKKFNAGSLNALSAAMNNVEDALQQTAEVAPVQPVAESAVVEKEAEESVEEPVAVEVESAPKKRTSRKKTEQLIGMNVQIPKSVYMKLQSIRVDRRISGRQLALELMELGLKHYNPKDYE